MKNKNIQDFITKVTIGLVGLLLFNINFNFNQQQFHFSNVINMVMAADTDGDGIDDTVDLDDDNDGLTDEVECSKANGEIAGHGPDAIYFDSFESPVLPNGHPLIATKTVELGDVELYEELPDNWTCVECDNLSPGNGESEFYHIKDVDGDGVNAVTDGTQAIWLDEGHTKIESATTFHIKKGNRYILTMDLWRDDQPFATAIDVSFAGMTQHLDITDAQGTDGTPQLVKFDFVADNDSDTKITMMESGATTASPNVDNVLLREITDNDQDGVPNCLDLDSDNDGISDLIESGQNAGLDTNNDGQLDDTTDVDGDGLMSVADTDDNDNTSAGSVVPVNTDGNDIYDYLDLDADNDGIPDVVEGQPTTGYTGNDGNVSDDVNAWGVPTYGLVSPEDTDGDGIFDYLDTDADNDDDGTKSDSQESGLTLSGQDLDGDGIDDGINASYQDPDGDVDNPSSDLSNEIGDTSEVAYREPVNHAPDAVNDNSTTNQDTAVTINVLSNDSDTDGDTLHVTAKTDPSHGTVVINGDDTITYTPTVGYTGLDSFTYTISDGNGGTDTATVNITVNSVNNTPTANDDNYTITEDSGTSTFQVVTGTDSGTADDFGGDGAGTNAITITSTPSHGTATVNTNGTANDPTDDYIEYTPNSNYNGSDSFVYQIEDADGDTDVATVNITVTAINDNPVANDDTNSTNENTTLTVVANGILGNDDDIDGDFLNITTFTDGTTTKSAGETLNLTEGDLTINADGSYTFVPATNYYGVVPQITYTISDGHGGTDIAHLDITVIPGDSDGDGINNAVDLDDDNDGIPDTDEGTVDSDGDGIKDYLDIDSDNDGIPDVIEAGGTDTDGDGHVDYATPGDPTTMVDVDNDGLADSVDTDQGGTALPVPDTDGDGAKDYVDIDADDDGIVDNIEGQTTAGYVAPSGTDTDEDGLDDSYDGDDETTVGIGGGTGTAIVPTNTDGADNPDYIDTDSDNDGDNDALEGWDTNNDDTADTTPAGSDADNDGLDDGYDADNTQINPTNGQTPTSFPDLDNAGGDRDWREALKDNDNITPAEEDAGPNGGDMNGDGILDSRQPDVTTYKNPIVNGYVSTTISGDCGQITRVYSYREADMDFQDSDFDYYIGLHGVEIECGTVGGTATIVHYWDKEYNTNEWTYRKYMESERKYIDFNDMVTYGTANVGGKTVTTVTFQVTDGGPYDEDGVANGKIVDPIGPAIKDKGNSSIGNTIWLDRNGNGKQDKGEPGLENIRVKLVWYGPNGKYDHGKKDDKVWRTDTNHNGHYKFENLLKGKYKVIVKDEDVRNYVQTYDESGKLNNQATIELDKNDNHTKADFGYGYAPENWKLAKTGDDSLLWITGLLSVLVLINKIKKNSKEYY